MAYSLKSLRKSGDLKSRDLYRVKIGDLVVVPGNNEREENARFFESIDELVDYLEGGGQVPPIEIRVNPESGAVEVIQGHRRRLAFLRVIPKRIAEATAAGLAQEKIDDLEYVDCLPFAGNDVDRVARIASGNTHLPLTDLEYGKVYARLRDQFKMTVADIARKCGVKRTFVDARLTLVDANHDVQQAVREGIVKPTAAAAAVKAHGDQAGTVIREAAKDGKRATGAAVAPKALSNKALARAELLAAAKEVVEANKGHPSLLRLSAAIEAVDVP